MQNLCRDSLDYHYRRTKDEFIGIARCGRGVGVWGWREEAGFDGVGGEFAELVEGEAVFLVGEDVLVEEVGAEQGGRRS